MPSNKLLQFNAMDSNDFKFIYSEKDLLLGWLGSLLELELSKFMLHGAAKQFINSKFVYEFVNVNNVIDLFFKLQTYSFISFIHFASAFFAC